MNIGPARLLFLGPIKKINAGDRFIIMAHKRLPHNILGRIIKVIQPKFEKLNE